MGACCLFAVQFLASKAPASLLIACTIAGLNKDTAKGTCPRNSTAEAVTVMVPEMGKPFAVRRKCPVLPSQCSVSSSMLPAAFWRVCSNNCLTLCSASSRVSWCGMSISSVGIHILAQQSCRLPGLVIFVRYGNLCRPRDRL